MPSKPCKYCGSIAHWPYQCFKNPKRRTTIKQKGKKAIRYDKWRDEVAIPHLDATTGRVCALCNGTRCHNKQLDVDHIQNRGSHPELIMSLSNVQYVGRYPCHYEKTNNISQNA